MWPDFFGEAGALVTRRSLGPKAGKQSEQHYSNRPRCASLRSIPGVMAPMPVHDDRSRGGIGAAIGAIRSGWPVATGIERIARPVIGAIGVRIILGAVA